MLFRALFYTASKLMASSGEVGWGEGGVRFSNKNWDVINDRSLIYDGQIVDKYMYKK